MAYSYDADKYCDSCGEAVIAGIDSGEIRGRNVEYPQWGPDDAEADCPQHCGNCGEFLENSLTTDGAQYVLDNVAEALRIGDTDSIAVTVWQPYYHWLDWPSNEE